MSEATEAVERVAEAARDLAQAIRELWRCDCGSWNRTSVCKRCGRAKGEPPETPAP